MESILTSIKKLLGITEEYHHFDADLIMHINSVLSILTQLGVGPSDGFMIEDDSATWYEFIPANKKFEIVKTFIHLKVKTIFDPPANSVVMQSMERMANELEWRISILAEEMAKFPSTDSDTPQIKPEEPVTQFAIDNVSVNDGNIVMNFKGQAPTDIPSLNTSLSDGNLYIANNGNYDLNFAIRNGSLQISDEVDSTEPDDSTETFEINNVIIDGHDVVVDYAGDIPGDIPTLNTSLSDGNLYVTNNGNYDMTLSVRNGMLHMNDDAESIEPDNSEVFKVDSVSINEHDVVMDYAGDVPDDIPRLESVISEGNVYVANNGNYNMNFSVNEGSLQLSS